MNPPVYVGMPSADRMFDVPKQFGPGTWGKIRCGGPCKDDYARIRHFADKGGRVITLQAAALDSFKSAEKSLGFPIVCTGTSRSCALQTSLYASDSHRFAPPNTTAHVRALAIDVSMAQSKRNLAKIRKALMARGWHQARLDDEPWHYSFGIEV